MTCVGAIPFTEGSGYESIEPNVLKKYGDDAHEQKVVLGISLVNVRSAILMKSRLTEDFSEDYITAGAVACMVWSHGYQVTLLSHARVTRTKEARDFKLGLKGKIMAGSVFFRAILLPSYFGRNLRTYFGCTII